MSERVESEIAQSTQEQAINQKKRPKNERFIGYLVECGPCVLPGMPETLDEVKKR